MTGLPPNRDRRLVRRGESFDSDEDYELERPAPTPEPPDIDKVSREHGERFRRWLDEHRGGEQ